jgi:hypothetical protein
VCGSGTDTNISYSRHAHQRRAVALRHAQSFGVHVTVVGAMPDVVVHGVEHPCQSHMGVRSPCHLRPGLRPGDEKLPGGRQARSMLIFEA